MPQVRLKGDQFLLTPDPHSISSGYFHNLASDFERFRDKAKFTDVNIWCNDGSLHAHKIVMASKSKLLSKFFEDNPMSSDIICPDFSIEALTGFLDLVYSGVTVVSNDSHHQRIDAVARSLDSGIELSSSAMCQLDLRGSCIPDIEDEVDPPESSLTDDYTNFSEESDLDDVYLLPEEPVRRQKKKVETKTTGSTFKCPECSKTFGKQIALKKHRERSHQENVSTTSPQVSEDIITEDLTIECPVCDEFVQSANLEKHSMSCKKPDEVPKGK